LFTEQWQSQPDKYFQQRVQQDVKGFSQSKALPDNLDHVHSLQVYKKRKATRYS
jgi:hypothetical protein